MEEWLTNCAVGNVFVIDFYKVLTTKGGDVNTDDIGLESDNHQRWWDVDAQHKKEEDDDTNSSVLDYPTGDNHSAKRGTKSQNRLCAASE